jgi:chromosome segregation ATPase
VSRFLFEAARQLEAERDAMMAENEELDGRRLDEVENRARAETERDAAREDVGALQVIVRGLTEERGQLRERIAFLEAERDHHMSERLRIESRLMRLQAVAVAADQLTEGRTAHSGCDCDECCLRARLAEVEEGDL